MKIDNSDLGGQQNSKVKGEATESFRHGCSSLRPNILYILNTIINYILPVMLYCGNEHAFWPLCIGQEILGFVCLFIYLFDWGFHSAQGIMWYYSLAA